MNKDTLQLMSDMLGEVIAGTWKGTPVCYGLIIGPIKARPKNVEGFNLSHWVEMEYNQAGDTCGYSACAVGHACFDPRFQALGLRMVDGIPTIPSMGGIDDWEAIDELFGITQETAEHLFYKRNYLGWDRYGVQPGQVKSRVDELLLIGEDKFNQQIEVLLDTNQMRVDT
ncbi:hypothetical protein D3C76_102910 [compost metagenome]